MLKDGTYEIVRTDPDYPDMAIVVDIDDYYLRYKFPIEWSDENIKIAIKFARRSYAQGIECGRESLRRELRNLIGAESEACSETSWSQHYERYHDGGA